MSNRHLGIHVECAGLFRLEKAKVDAAGNEIAGTRMVVRDWFPNLILDNGLNLMASTSFLAACQVGSGSLAPAATQTLLQSRIAGSSTIQADVRGTNNTTAPYYGWRRRTYRFAAGTATGNISELGIGPTSDGPLMSRALVLDALGNPTSITILPDEVLDVTYEFRLYVPMTDATGTITLATEGSTHTWTSRAIDVDAAQYTSWDFDLGIQPFEPSNIGGYWLNRIRESNELLPITSDSGYTPDEPTSVTAQPYVNGTYYRDFLWFLDLNKGNYPSGLGMLTTSGGFGAFQFAFSPKIPKVATKKLNITTRISWARKAL